MKYILIVVMLFLVFIGIWNYVSLKKYCKKHETECLEKHEKYVISKLIIIAVSGIVCGLLGIIIQFTQ